MSKLTALLAPVVTVLLTVAIPASATTITLASAPASYVNNSFDSGTLPSGWTASGPNAGIVSTSVTNQYMAPSGDSTPFAYAGVGSSITATFASGISGLSLLWGSPDSWNTITFSGPGGTESFSPGSGLLSILDPTNTGSMNVLFIATPGSYWTTVTFSSAAPAFEFDNVATLAATTTAVPEPATLALVAGALSLFALRRRKA
jgi:hypothetical protein